MTWEIEFTDEFGAWWNELTEAQQDAVDRVAELLEARGPQLGFPYSSDIKGSRHGRLRELRVQAQGRPLRVLYAFDPRRMAMLLLGGDKTGDDAWYAWAVPEADRLYDEHIETLRREKLL
jgi:hypothetical protein